MSMVGLAAMRTYWATTLAVLSVAVGMALFYAPVDESMGLVQKLIYLHLPAAIAALFAAMSVFVGNLAFLWTRSRVWDEMASAGARVTVFCSLIVLLTGMVWGQSYWGFWWTWSPKLTFTLILCVLYAVYLGLRLVVRPWHRRAVVCAVYGAVAFLDVPLVYLSVRLLPDVHPTSLPLTPEMRQTLIPWFVFVALAGTGLIATPVARRARRHAEHALGAAHVTHA
ncbi:Heme exporter protein C [Phycisphaerales bacterium]|nr:Heme exporter protein C [Phycisphaerales bacterium]